MNSDYQLQLEDKRLRLKSLFKNYTDCELEVFSSPESHYRMRAEFRIWHEGEDLYFYMIDKITKERIRTEQYLPAGRLINEMMKLLILEIRGVEELRRKLFQVDFLSTLSGEILVTLLYHRQLNDAWIIEAKILKKNLESKFKVNLIGRARKQKIDLVCDYVVEEILVAGKKLKYKQVENSFTQPNTAVAIKMLEWGLDVTEESCGDLLELYCGNGNFSIALARNFEKVLATELSGPAVDAAQFNIQENQVNNVQIIRMSAEDFSDAMAGKREYHRLKGIDLKSYNCQTILVDPPRAGLDKNTLALIQRYKHILYISCNPDTLIENLEILSKTHRVERLALFDQFPYTEHIECGVSLRSL